MTRTLTKMQQVYTVTIKNAQTHQKTKCVLFLTWDLDTKAHAHNAPAPQLQYRFMQEVGGYKMETLVDVPVFRGTATGLIDYTKVVIDDARKCAEFQFSVGDSTCVYFEKRRLFSAQVCDSINMVQCEFECFARKLKNRQLSITRNNTGHSDESQDLDDMVLAAREMIDNLELHDDESSDDEDMQAGAEKLSHLHAAQAIIKAFDTNESGGSYDEDVYAGAAKLSAKPSPTDLFPDSGWKVTLVRPGDTEYADDADVHAGAEKLSHLHAAQAIIKAFDTNESGGSYDEDVYAGAARLSAKPSPTDLFPDSGWKVTLVRPGDTEYADDADVHAGAEKLSHLHAAQAIIKPFDTNESGGSYDEDVYAGAAKLSAKPSPTDLFPDSGWKVPLVRPGDTEYADDADVYAGAAKPSPTDLFPDSAWKVTLVRPGDTGDSDDEDVHAGAAKLPVESSSTDLFSNLGWEVTFVSPRGTRVLDSKEAHMRPTRTLAEFSAANGGPPSHEEDVHAGPAMGRIPHVPVNSEAGGEGPAFYRRELSKREISRLNNSSPTTFTFNGDKDMPSVAAFRKTFQAAQQRTDSTRHMLKNVKEWVNFYKFCRLNYNHGNDIDTAKIMKLFKTPHAILSIVKTFQEHVAPEQLHGDFNALEAYVAPLPLEGDLQNPAHEVAPVLLQADIQNFADLIPHDFAEEARKLGFHH
jgi:hypothetical protein